jgi:hypothetical protein
MKFKVIEDWRYNQLEKRIRRKIEKHERKWRI